MSDRWLGSQPKEFIPRLKSLVFDLERLANNQRVRFVEEPVQIENWIMMRRAVPCLAGVMSGHPNVEDGHTGITTEIFFLDEERGIARSMNRWYQLNTPSFAL